jgi:hypothetical protein
MEDSFGCRQNEVPRYDRKPVLLGVLRNITVGSTTHPNFTNIKGFMTVTLEQLGRGTWHVGVDEEPHF